MIGQPCKKCGNKPRITKITDLYYAQCSGKGCAKWNPYEFLGLTPDSAMDAWNIANTKGNNTENI